MMILPCSTNALHLIRSNLKLILILVVLQNYSIIILIKDESNFNTYSLSYHISSIKYIFSIKYTLTIYYTLLTSSSNKFFVLLLNKE